MCTVVGAGVAGASYPVVVEGRDGGHRRAGGTDFGEGVGCARSEYRD